MSAPDLRLRSLEGFADDIQALDDDRDDYRVVIGDIAPCKSTTDLRERLEFEDAFVVGTDTPEPTTEAVEDGHCARYVDYQYPDFAFDADLTETNPLDTADAQFAGTHFFPTERLDTSHHRVLEFGEFYDVFQRVIDTVDDPTEYAAMTGYFNPAGGEWSIISEGAFFRLHSVAFPRGISPDDDATLLRKANMAFSGLLIVPRDVLSEQALDVVEGTALEATA